MWQSKDDNLVCRAFATIKSPLNKIQILHTDRENEFKIKAIDGLLSTFKIERALSKIDCQYDNAVAKATLKVIKTEFAFNRKFKSFEQLELELFNYVNWYNNHRIHGSLSYSTTLIIDKWCLRKKCLKKC